MPVIQCPRCGRRYKCPQDEDMECPRCGYYQERDEWVDAWDDYIDPDRRDAPDEEDFENWIKDGDDS